MAPHSRLAALPLLAATGLTLLCGRAPVAIAEPVRLGNGVTVVSVPGAEPLSVALAMSTGRADDPAGREGLAELTARSLTAATKAHRGGGDLVYRLASSVGAAELEVSPNATTFILSDVRDLPAALRLMTDALAKPAFPLPDVLAARRSLELEALEGLTGGAMARRTEALAGLTGTSSAWERAWAVAALDPEDVPTFHSEHFGPSGLRVAITGAAAPTLDPALADLPGDLASGLGAWAPAKELPASVRGSLSSGSTVLLTAANEPGVTLAFPAPDAAAFLALLAAADASSKGKWTIGGAGRGIGGAVAPPPGAVLLAECTTSEPAATAKDLLAQLNRLAKRAPRDAAWSGLVDPARHEISPGERAAACLDALDAGRTELGDCGVRGLLSAVTPESIRVAAAALASGPRSLVGAVADESAVGAWKTAFPASLVQRADEPADATGRERVAEARTWLKAAVVAHGGQALTSLSGWTRLSDEGVSMDDQVKPFGALRLDTNAEPATTRTEFRPLAKQLGTRIVVLNDWSAERRDGAAALDAVEATAIRTQLLHQPLLMLQRAASGRFPVRSEGIAAVDGRRLRHVSVADPDAGLTTLSFDEKSGQLVSARFRQRIRSTLPPRDVTLSWSDLRVVEGVLVPFRETMRAGESGMSQVSVATAWTMRRQAFDPARLSTSPDDLALERTAQ